MGRASLVIKHRLALENEDDPLYFKSALCVLRQSLQPHFFQKPLKLLPVMEMQR